MSKPQLSTRLQLCLVALFGVVMIMLWTLPVMLAGYPYALPSMLKFTQAIVETGEWLPTSARLMPHLIRLLVPFIGWTDISAWAMVSASAFALALLPWWYTVRTLFNAKIAWFSTIVLALLPIYWVETLDLGGYTFALFFLFLGFASFVHFRATHRLLAVILFGVCFGLTLACKDAFVAFLPWLTLGYLLDRRANWKKGIGELATGLACAYIMFALPLFPNAVKPDMSLTQRVAVFLPALGSSTPGEGHLYPDPYIYEFHKAEYDTLLEEHVEEDSSFFGRQQDQHYRLIFGVGEFSVFDTIFNGVWLFLNTLPQLFVQEYVGGAFLWIFILPGLVYLYRERRKFFWNLIGLWLSMELFIRFVLHFGRTHLNDMGWELALLAGIGLALTSDAFVTHIRIRRHMLGAVILGFLVAMQLVQANRKLLAFEYSRSIVPMSYAAAEVINPVSADAVIAHPRQDPLFFFTNHTGVSIHPDTIDFLTERGALREPFEHYGVTHIIGYDKEYSERITKELPNIQVLQLPGAPPKVPVNAFMKYLLHLVR